MRPALRRAAESQAGLVTRRQCEVTGYTQADLRALTRKHGPWVVVRRGVYAERTSWEASEPAVRLALVDRAAHLTMDRDHVMSHDSSARALEIPLLWPRRELVHVTRDGVGGSRTEHGVKHHLTRCELGEVLDVRGLPVTGPARTALDLAREQGLQAGVVALDHVRARGVREADLRRELEVMRSWPNVRRVRRAVELSDARAESPAESLGRLLLVEMGFEDIDVQWPVRIGGGVAWTDLRIGCHVVEVDGLGKYFAPGSDSVSRNALRDERSRQAAICAEGLGMSRLGWDDFFGRRRAVAMDQVAREHAVTVARFGRVLPTRLAEQAALIRRTSPRRRSA